MGAVLYLMRHGAAEDRAPSGRDSDRALTDTGRDVVRRVAIALHDTLAGPIVRVVASPLVRAQQTAEIVRDILCPGVDIDVDEDLAPDASAYDLAVRAAHAPGSTLLVGHQPNIEMVARALGAPGGRYWQPREASAIGAGASASGVRMPVGFRTATVVGFHIAGRPPPYLLALAVDPADL